jgi:hypothetical protein
MNKNYFIIINVNKKLNQYNLMIINTNTNKNLKFLKITYYS